MFGMEPRHSILCVEHCKPGVGPDRLVLVVAYTQAAVVVGFEKLKNK